jgi:hypothetical protein
VLGISLTDAPFQCADGSRVRQVDGPLFHQFD